MIYAKLYKYFDYQSIYILSVGSRKGANIVIVIIEYSNAIAENLKWLII